MKSNCFYKFVSITGFSLGALFMYIIINPKEVKQPEIKPCVCVTYSQYALWQAKYDMYVDKNKPDSVAKYAELLNQIK